MYTMNYDPILERLCEEFVFWNKYIYQKQATKTTVDDRMYRALDFAWQRLETYLSAEEKNRIL